MMWSKRWWSSAVAAPRARPKVIYNAASETLIVESHAVSSNDSPIRLFIRHKDAASYEQIGNPPEDVSYESPVTCEKQPLVLFNALSCDKVRKRRDWTALYLFNVKTRELKPHVWSGRLTLPEPYNDFRISDLIRLSDDGERLYLTVGLRWLNQMRVDFYLAQLDLTEMNFQPISPLRDPFF